jgi:hypothetical protein
MSTELRQYSKMASEERKKKKKRGIWASIYVCTYGTVLAKIGCAVKKCHVKNIPKPLEEKYGLMGKTRSLYA